MYVNDFTHDGLNERLIGRYCGMGAEATQANTSIDYAHYYYESYLSLTRSLMQFIVLGCGMSLWGKRPFPLQTKPYLKSIGG